MLVDLVLILRTTSKLKFRLLLNNFKMNVLVSIVVKRKALVMVPLSGFPLDYHRWKESLGRSEARPFIEDFYYKKGSLTQQRFQSTQTVSAPLIAQTAKIPFVVQPAEPELVSVLNDLKTKEAGNEILSQVSIDRCPEESIYLFLKQDNGEFRFY